MTQCIRIIIPILKNVSLCRVSIDFFGATLSSALNRIESNRINSTFQQLCYYRYPLVAMISKFIFENLACKSFFPKFFFEKFITKKLFLKKRFWLFTLQRYLNATYFQLEKLLSFPNFSKSCSIFPLFENGNWCFWLPIPHRFNHLKH